MTSPRNHRDGVGWIKKNKGNVGRGTDAFVGLIIGAVIGGAIGGPVGAVIGAIIGAILPS